MAILSLLSMLFLLSMPEKSTTNELEQLLTTQAECWNRGDIEGFMETYWKSDDLTFSGGGKCTRGWQATLDRYKKNYPKDEMGHLTFDGLEITMLGDEAALILGNWQLTNPQKDKEAEEKGGNFSLVLKKIEGAWKIIHDHSSTLEQKENDTGE
jgi:uncharacterized protein (TIGR02246 family)